jgi:hypothetical protein
MTTSKALSTSMILFVLAIGLTAVVSPAANGDSKQSWKKLQLQAHRLSVSMPGTATPKDIHTKSFIGDITTHEYYVDNGRDSYSVEFSDLPGFAVAFSGSDVIYEHAKGALLKKTLSKPISFTEIKLAGVRGKRLVYDTPTKPDHPEMQGEARLFLFGHRLYIADAAVEMDGGEEKLRRFFSSLDIEK